MTVDIILTIVPAATRIAVCIMFLLLEAKRNILRSLIARYEVNIALRSTAKTRDSSLENKNAVIDLRTVFLNEYEIKLKYAVKNTGPLNTSIRKNANTFLGLLNFPDFAFFIYQPVLYKSNCISIHIPLNIYSPCI